MQCIRIVQYELPLEVQSFEYFFQMGNNDDLSGEGHRPIGFVSVFGCCYEMPIVRLHSRTRPIFRATIVSGTPGVCV